MHPQIMHGHGALRARRTNSYKAGVTWRLAAQLNHIGAIGTLLLPLCLSRQNCRTDDDLVFCSDTIVTAIGHIHIRKVPCVWCDCGFDSVSHLMHDSQADLD